MAVGRTILAVVGGVIAAGGTIALVEVVGHAVVSDAAVFGVAVLGYGVGAVVGALVTTLIAGRRAAIAIPVILAVLAATNLFSFPHPAWFAPAAAGALALGWWTGSLIAAGAVKHTTNASTCGTRNHDEENGV